jgi:hypothetical protein
MHPEGSSPARRLISDNITGSETNDLPVKFTQFLGTVLVIRHCVGMLLAVDFNDQSAFLAGKIGDEGPNRELPSEFQVLQLAIAKRLPQLLLRFARLLSHLPGEVSQAIDGAIISHGFPSP